MKKRALGTLAAISVPLLLSARADERPQIGQIGRVVKGVQQFRDLQITDAEERQIGEAVSGRIRLRYGVAQDKAVHRYVSLVGAILVEKTGRPGPAYQFVVLDTDGVNAFAAPGGFVHVTRGALALLRDEAELAGVLAHEIVHIADKHTIRAMQKGKTLQIGASETFSASGPIFDGVVNKVTDAVLAGPGRTDELEADEKGIVLANAAGYAPGSLGGFLARLVDRNKASAEKQGMFSSHPESKERLDKLSALITSRKLTASATVADRYAKTIKYEAKSITEIATVDVGAAGLTGGAAAKPADKPADKPKEEPKRRGFGIGNLLKPGSGGNEKKSAEVTGSAAARGVDTERNAKGGPNPTPVTTTLTPKEIDAFKKEGKIGQ